MIELQYDLFQEQLSELDELKLVCATLKDSQDRQRKAMFAKIGASGKEVIQILEEVHRLKFEVESLKKMLSIS